MSTTPYTLAPGSEHNLTERIANAYRAASLTPPHRGDELRRLLADEPGPDALARDLAVESLTVRDLQSWTEDAITRVHRAHAVDTLRRAVAQHRSTAAKRNTPTLIADAAADLAKPFDKAAKRLVKAARDLPAGDPLDLQAVVDTDTTAERRTTLEALAIMARLASVFTRRHVSDLPTPARDALVVVDVPTVPRAQVHRLTRAVVNPDERRDHVRQLILDAERYGATRAVIEAARGTYGDQVVLAWPTDMADLTARWERAADAAGGTLVDQRPANVLAT